jgi:hypothetical protein
LKGFCRLFPRKKHEESDKKLEVILKILRKKQKLKGFCRLLRRKKYIKKATKSLKSHFKNFKKKTKIERLLSIIEKKETYEQSDQKLGKSF